MTRAGWSMAQRSADPRAAMSENGVDSIGKVGEGQGRRLASNAVSTQMPAAQDKQKMTRYARELAALSATYQRACEWDVSSLARLVSGLATQPLRVVGSGGSYSIAAFCARLHTWSVGQPAHPATPLDVVRTPFVHGAGVLCLTASGRNKDICAAFEASALAETKPTSAFCLAEGSPIKALAVQYGFTDIVETALDIESDGFLAVNSLLASCVLLARAYRIASGAESELPGTFDDLMAHTSVSEDFDAEMREALSRNAVSVLYSPAVAAAATDLESRFVEGALGNLHIADWRNFGHGRHHWLAKRGTETGVVALIAESDASLARRTLATIPDGVRRAAIRFTGDEDVQAIAALVSALKIAGVAGELVGIDPGRPGVPEFGRKLYGLGPRVSRPSISEIAVARKARVAPELETVFRSEREAVLAQIGDARACGVVLDYDGTLCDRRRRFDPLDDAIAAALRAILDAGAIVGIATGRGRSAGTELERVLPRDTWARVLIGYYNGAVIHPLGSAPTDTDADETGTKIAERLKKWFPRASVEARRWQVSAEGFRHGRLPAIAHTASRLLAEEGLPAYVVCSSHSIDVLLTERRKCAVVDAVKAAAGKGNEAQVIRVGDRGLWPGNDFDLLDDVMGLSVDEVSRDPGHCWNFAPPGVSGPQTTIHYLQRISPARGGGLRLDVE